jgi:16S rRNA (guanine966-N2)-methyltransferase
MRVVAGHAKGRLLRVPKGAATRPFTGRAKEAVFSILGGSVVGARVLDLYAGSGSLGLEALSRGAQSVTFVESSRSALAALRANVAAVGLGGEVLAGDAARFVERTRAEFDLIFFDPPYAMPSGELAPLLEAAAHRLGAGGSIVVHRRHGTPLELLEGTMLSIGDRRRYGDAEVWWLDKEKR